ncbi:TetR family transcriptional regulator [Georgenia sp. 10Sc9-8]|uniref:TetR family transcriptional regulator n=1 Tax=Georgenia halotolerans TaxID=3028317 RepID=A0ABT5TT17_9MICO|nr:TetR family transcriptional regulator [Georgenia halotolerans]
MVIVRSPDHVTPADLTTRARIRQAAIVRFGQEGFGVGLRAIAADAGVSPALIVRHYGSKAGLREACDESVLRLVRDSKTTTVGAGSPTAVLDQLARIEEYGPALLYVVASLNAGGPLARELVEHMVADALEYLEAGVANGVIRPSRDPEARARFLTRTGLGALLLQLRLEADDDHLDVATVMQAVERATLLPGLELYTYGLFTDTGILDTVLAAQQAADHGTGAPAGHAPRDVDPDPPTGGA